MDKKKHDENLQFSWKLTDHLCRVCFGRVLVRTTTSGMKVYLCSNCETEAEGVSSKVLCACGLQIGKKDAGIRCHINTSIKPEDPGIVVASQVTSTKGSL